MGPQQQSSGMMQHQQQHQQLANPAGMYPDVDMSHLSEEERMLIESVMAKAQMEELDLKTPAPGNMTRSVHLYCLSLSFH